jgi:hypothetical protein
VAALVNLPDVSWTFGPMGTRDSTGAAPLGDEGDDQAPAVGHPVEVEEDGVDGGRSEGLRDARLHIQPPEFDPVIEMPEEGDRPAVGRPRGRGEPDAVRQGDPPHNAGLHVLQADRRIESQDLPAVGRRRDPHPGDPQDGLREIGDGRHGLVFDESHGVPVGAHGHERSGRRVEDIDDLLRRELVRFLGGDERRRGQEDGQKERRRFERAGREGGIFSHGRPPIGGFRGMVRHSGWG